MSATHIELRFGPDNDYMIRLAVTEENRQFMLNQLLAAAEQLMVKKKTCSGQKMLSFCTK